MTRFPNLKHLYYLTVLHKEQHFLKAAQKCNVSQSTLSTAIQNLEDGFGQQLLEREHKTFVFTDFGEAMVERSKILLSHTNDWIEFATSLGDWQNGVLRMGAIPTIAPFIFESMIHDINAVLPRITLQLTEDTTDSLLDRLADGELDLLVLALPMKTSGCRQLTIGRDPFHLIGHKTKLSEFSNNVKIDELPNESIFLLQKEHCMTDHAVSACGLAHKSQVSSLSASSLHTLVSLVNSELGYSFLPSLALKKGILNGSEVEAMPSENNAHREIGLVWRTGTTRVQLFRNIGKILSNLMPVPVLVD